MFIGCEQMQTDKIKETIPIGTRITEAMQKGIAHVLATDGHLNTSDYVRDIIRKDLEKRGLLAEQSIPA